MPLMLLIHEKQTKVAVEPTFTVSLVTLIEKSGTIKQINDNVINNSNAFYCSRCI